jgi:glutamyl-tRNA synthetase
VPGAGAHPSGTLPPMTDRPLRVRFAPSPTGYFHVGGARTALWNWILAVQSGGTFVLRIEDTDIERNRPEWTAGILESLRWLGIEWHEGPYFQSERGHLHTEAADRLVAEGRAYYCDCTREQVEARSGATAGYDRHCRSRGLTRGPGRALRFATPLTGTTTVVDLVRGEPTFDNALIEDFVLVRGNGTPMFLLANVVDDLSMGITHVIRGEEHLPNTPKALLLWAALGGGEPPVFAHVPVLVNEARQKLSKRRDKVALESYRDEGYLRDALRNYLMCLGWAPKGDVEIVPWEQILEEFRIADVTSSPAFFDVKKLQAFNGEYIRALPPEEFVAACRPWVEGPDTPWPAGAFDAEAFRAMAPHVQERVRVLAEVPQYVDFLFCASPPDDPAAWQKVMTTATAAAVLDGALAALASVAWGADALKEAVAAVGEAAGLKLAKAQAPVRVAVTGRTVGPPLFESLEVLGRERTLERLREARARL